MHMWFGSIILSLLMMSHLHCATTPSTPLAQNAPIASSPTAEPTTPSQPSTQAATTVPQTPPIQREGLVAHQAEYQLSLEKNENPDVADVQGSLKITMRDTGNGWAFEQHSVVTVIYNDKTTDTYTTTIASWESNEGDSYRFDVVSHRNGCEEVVIRGKATLDETGAGVVEYQSPHKSRKALPVGTLFPLQHLKLIIKAATSNQNMCANRIVFDGSSESFEPVEVNVLINPPFKPKIKVHGSNEIDFDKAWTITMGVYDREEKSMEPDYETKQTILKNGVITSMNMNYDENGFTTKLTLNKLEVFM